MSKLPLSRKLDVWFGKSVSRTNDVWDKRPSEAASFSLEEEFTIKKESQSRNLGMGWVWRDDSSTDNDFNNQPLGDSAAESNCSISKVVRSQCKTEEVEPGKFVRKCEKTEERLRHCFGKPSEIIESTTEHTEEDVTNQMTGRSAFPNQYPENPLNFPGLRNDMDAIERHFFSGMKGFFEAAEEMKSSLFDIMGDHHSSTRRGIPIEANPKIEEHRNENSTGQSYTSGEIDLSGLAKDV